MTTAEHPKASVDMRLFAYPKVRDDIKRFTATEDTWQSAHAASLAAQEWHNQTFEEVQCANFKGEVFGYISADGRGYGCFATCG